MIPTINALLISFWKVFQPERLKLQFSPVLAVLVISVHLLAAFAVNVSIDAPLLKLFLFIALTLQGIHLCRCYVWLNHSTSVKSIRWTDSQWFVTLAGGVEIEVVLTPSCRVFDRFVLLRVRSVEQGLKPKSYNLWLPGGVDSADATRRLRVQLILNGSSQN